MPGTAAAAYFVTTLSFGSPAGVTGSPGAPFSEGANGTAAISRTKALRFMPATLLRRRARGQGRAGTAGGRVRVRDRARRGPQGGIMKKMALAVMKLAAGGRPGGPPGGASAWPRRER